LPPRGVAKRRCCLLSKFFDNFVCVCGCVRYINLDICQLSVDTRPYLWLIAYRIFHIIHLAASNGKRNVTVWRPSVSLSRRHTHRDLPRSSMRRGQRTFRPFQQCKTRVRVKSFEQETISFTCRMSAEGC